MHLSPLEAIIMLLFLPTIGTILFWRLRILRSHRIARWLLAPFIYLGIAVIGVVVGNSFGWYTDIRPSRAEYVVNLEEWKNHPQVKEVRAIYDEIKGAIRANKFKSETRKYDVESSSCSSPYPIKSKSLIADEEGDPRLLKVDQIISHREILTVERYYDGAGWLRFVYVDRGSGSTRIYLNTEGKVFWAVEQDGDKFTVGDSAAGDWETEPSNVTAAKEMFNETESCPETTK